jgi:membrane protein implicated in regulation of membrane protease activity
MTEVISWLPWLANPWVDFGLIIILLISLLLIGKEYFKKKSEITPDIKVGGSIQAGRDIVFGDKIQYEKD